MLKRQFFCSRSFSDQPVMPGVESFGQAAALTAGLDKSTENKLVFLIGVEKLDLIPDCKLIKN